MPKIIVPAEKEHTQDWKELFKDDLAAFPKGVQLRESATLPCSRTLGPIKLPPMDSFKHWELKQKITKKPKQRNENFTRRYWDAQRLVEGFCAVGQEERVFSDNQCDQHPISVAWWWAIHGCKACQRTMAMKMDHFKEKVVKQIGPRFPEFHLADTANVFVEERNDDESPRRMDLDITRHPVLRPPTPLRRDSSKSRQFTEAEKKKRRKRLTHLANKYPYYQPLINCTDESFTYPTIKKEPIARQLGRSWSTPAVGWK